MYIMTAGYYCLEKENQKGRSYMQCVCVCVQAVTVCL